MDAPGLIEGVYYDGETAARSRVPVSLSEDGRLLLSGGATADWPVAGLAEMSDRSTRALILGPAGGEARLVVSDPRDIARLRALLPGLRRRPAPRRQVRRALIWSAGALGALALLIFVVIPGLSDQLARWIPPEREVAFGESLLKQIRRFNPFSAGGEQALALCTAPEGAAALARMTARLTEGQELPLPVTVTVLDHGLVNAFALPGGQVILFRGLIEAADSPDEVAAVLAHEIGHVAHRDPTRLALRSAGSAGILGLAFGDFAGGFATVVVADQLIAASYSQTAEAEADTFAHARLAGAAVDPAALGDFFERLRDEHGDADGLIAHFMSHPRLAARIEAARAAPAGPGPVTPALDAAGWTALRGICTQS